jgi:hypothetical protein
MQDGVGVYVEWEGGKGEEGKKDVLIFLCIYEGLLRYCLYILLMII